MFPHAFGATVVRWEGYRAETAEAAIAAKPVEGCLSGRLLLDRVTQKRLLLNHAISALCPVDDRSVRQPEQIREPVIPVRMGLVGRVASSGIQPDLFAGTPAAEGKHALPMYLAATNLDAFEQRGGAAARRRLDFCMGRNCRRLVAAGIAKPSAPVNQPRFQPPAKRPNGPSPSRPLRLAAR